MNKTCTFFYHQIQNCSAVFHYFPISISFLFTYILFVIGMERGNCINFSRDIARLKIDMKQRREKNQA